MTMSQTDSEKAPSVAVEDIQQGWHDLKLRVAQLEADRAVLAHENKDLRSLLERVVEHRQKSHSELINLLSGLVSKLPINDIGVVVSRLMEHNAHVAEVCAALAKGKVEATQIQPQMLRVLDQTKRDLRAAIEPAVTELIKRGAPLEPALLRALVADPNSYSAPAFVRASRCFVKGQVPRERVVREFGEAALIFFNDMTTDPKLNPRPKPDDIVLSFASNFDAVLQQNPDVITDKRAALQALHQSVQRSKAATTEARELKNLFLHLAFILELLHYYENQNTESPEVVFAQRLPPVIEQLVVSGPQDNLDEKMIVQAETLLAFIINQDHRLSVINNTGKAGGTAKSAKFVLRLRAEKAPTENASILHEVLPEFIKHLISPPPTKPDQQLAVAAVLRFLNPDLQKIIVKGIMNSDRLRKDEAEPLCRTLAKELNLSGWEEAGKAAVAVPPEMERQLAWDKVRDLIIKRADPTAVATAIRERLHAKYDSDEIKQSWLTLVEADAITLIRAVCQLPYLPDGRTDSIARPVIEAYVARLMHEKYLATYTKVINSLKNMFKAKPDSPTLVNFVALVRWADAAAADKLSADIGMTAHAPAH
jgi:hypothetical protein